MFRQSVFEPPPPSRRDVTRRREPVHIPDHRAALKPRAQGRPVSRESRWRLTRSSDAISSLPPAASLASCARGRLALCISVTSCNSLKEEPMPLSHSTSAITCVAWLAFGIPVSASANVITDWDEKAVAVVMPPGPVTVPQQVYTAQRLMGMVDVAMFDAVNSIERRYQPYLVQLPADPATSKEAAAAAAAATVLATTSEKIAGEMKVALA